MIKVGMELILETDNQNEEKYRSKIADYDGNKIYISYPLGVTSKKTIFLRTDTNMYATFIDEESGAYLFKTKVIGRLKNQIPLLILTFPDEENLMKIQRRQFVRIDVAIDVSLHLLETGEVLPTITDDFSAGGCAVILPQNVTIDRGALGKICVVLPMQSGEYIYLNLDCRIIRSFDKNKRQLASIQFLNVTNKEQQQLMRFCFEKQLEYRKRGLTN
ncbi:flagellar brake protein [Lederbergia wuyishanensis]|uniref:C-di-GMP-binding flagellar brake protein YcgR n=1 Tax=Lederbergia wuyishanensis TaxID=1347903 RepID=A0ABU0D0Z4_9BACI|nr:flagellar brake domain-containing protein [Lederbergia wuyishanensis]MCJ8006692.1 flagellar brake domain-containing protein [Lederbergia wuyishanensis]MDQ0342074.1 c-di-GMP-binding flagellar brake protein YcgR [Lederbergia wuyishanensis]